MGSHVRACGTPRGDSKVLYWYIHVPVTTALVATLLLPNWIRRQFFFMPARSDGCPISKLSISANIYFVCWLVAPYSKCHFPVPTANQISLTWPMTVQLFAKGDRQSDWKYMTQIHARKALHFSYNNYAPESIRSKHGQQTVVQLSQSQMIFPFSRRLMTSIQPLVSEWQMVALSRYLLLVPSNLSYTTSVANHIRFCSRMCIIPPIFPPTCCRYVSCMLNTVLLHNLEVGTRSSLLEMVWNYRLNTRPTSNILYMLMQSRNLPTPMWQHYGTSSFGGFWHTRIVVATCY